MLRKHRSPGLNLTVSERPQLRELHLTVTPLPNESIVKLFRRLTSILEEHDATVVRQEVFGAVAAREEALRVMEWQFGKLLWPVTWTQGAECSDRPIAGMHLTAVSGAQPEPIDWNGHIVGCLYQEGATRHCCLGALEPSDLSASRMDQAVQTFENLEAVLDQVGMKLSDVVRTWFFLEDILGWYGDFNKIRTDFFQSRRVFDGLVPASTGVGTKNPKSTAVQAAARACQTAPGTVSRREVESPLQCSATDYGSSFSRAVEQEHPGYRQVVVSGTASIEPGGASACVGDVAGQIDLTMRVVRAILASREMDFSDASRITAYFKSPRDVRFFDAWMSKHGIQRWPVVCVQAEICRDELLFEIELDAVTACQVSS